MHSKKNQKLLLGRCGDVNDLRSRIVTVARRLNNYKAVGLDIRVAFILFVFSLCMFVLIIESEKKGHCTVTKGYIIRNRTGKTWF